MARTTDDKIAAMPTSEAHIHTDRPSRYLVQFCKHANAIGSADRQRLPAHGDGANALQRVTVRAEWSDTTGTVTLYPWGQCRLEAKETRPSIRVEARDDDTLQRIKNIVSTDIERFTGGALTPTWHHPEPPATGSA